MRARRRRPELPTQNSSADWSFNFPMTKTLAHQLADYTCSVRFEDLSKETVHEVRRRMVDSIGCAIGAWNKEPCKIARSVASEFSAKNGSTIIGTAPQAPPDWAAFATGCCIRYFDYNDTYLSKEPAHPSDNISAALAIAESIGASGRELIAAIALAYEVRCREPSCAGLGPRDLRCVFDCTGLCAFDEAGPGENAPCGQHCRRCLRRDAPGARGRTFALEGGGLREFSASRRLLGAARPRRY